LVEHNTFNVGALGSSPSGITEVSKVRVILEPFSFLASRWARSLPRHLLVNSVLQLEFPIALIHSFNRKFSGESQRDH
jgi:hypothetical protein